MTSTPASRARDYTKTLDWLANDVTQLQKSLSQFLFFGADIRNEADHKYNFCLFLSTFSTKILGRRITTVGYYNSYWRHKYPWLTWDDFLYKAFHRRTQLERSHERTPMHAVLLPHFDEYFKCDVDGTVDWSRHTPSKRGQLFLTTEEAIEHWEELGNVWLLKGPDKILPPGQRDPRRNFPNTKKFAKSIFAIWGERCYWCKAELKLSWQPDHFYPWSKGGRTTATNCVPSCTACNKRKLDMWPDEFLISHISQIYSGRPIQL